MMKKEVLIKDYLLITISALLIALAVNLFFKEHTMAPGGITGMSIIFSSFTGVPVEYMSPLISIPLLILGVIFLGKSFGVKTLYITLIGPVFLKLIPDTHVTDNLLVAGIVGGLLVGTAIGIAIVRQCATGGTDLAALLINKVFKSLKIPKILLVLDGLVVISSGVISKNYSISIYSFLSLLVIIYSIKFIVGKFSSSALV
ncbi:YitT family protein [Neobacillus rhizosphaerae]|nr:YitT family protein [Neobacillus rhizosphaerae]